MEAQPNPVSNRDIASPCMSVADAITVREDCQRECLPNLPPLSILCLPRSYQIARGRKRGFHGRRAIHFNVKLPRPIDLPPRLYRWLSDEAMRRSVSMEQVVRLALDQLIETEKKDYDVRQTRTWQLCGALEVSEPDPEYGVGRDAKGQEITNYAEHVDDVLYRGV